MKQSLVFWKNLSGKPKLIILLLGLLFVYLLYVLVALYSGSTIRFAIWNINAWHIAKSDYAVTFSPSDPKVTAGKLSSAWGLGGNPTEQTEKGEMVKMGNVNVTLPAIVEEQAYFETTDNPYLLKQIKYSTRNPKSFSGLEGLEYAFTILEDKVYFTNDNKLFEYDSLSKKLRYVDLLLPEYANPDFLANGPYVDRLSAEELLVTLNDLNLDQHTYLVNFDSNTFTEFFGPDTEGFESPSMGGAASFEKIDDKHLLVFQGYGDVCVSTGTIKLMDIETKKVKQVMEWVSGCSKSDLDSYIGTVDGKLITAGREWIDSESEGEFSGNEIYKSVNLLDPISVKKTVLLGSEKMPKDIVYITTDASTKIINLYTEAETEGESFGYTLNMDNGSLSDLRRLKNLDTYSSKNQEDWKKLFKVNKKETKLGDVAGVKTNSRWLQLVDTAGTNADFFDVDEWEKFYKNHIKYNDDEDNCLTWTRFSFNEATLSGKILKFTVLADPPINTLFNCKEKPPKQRFNSTLDLKTGDLFIESLEGKPKAEIW